MVFVASVLRDDRSPVAVWPLVRQRSIRRDRQRQHVGDRFGRRARGTLALPRLAQRPGNSVPLCRSDFRPVHSHRAGICSQRDRGHSLAPLAVVAASRVGGRLSGLHDRRWQCRLGLAGAAAAPGAANEPVLWPDAVLESAHPVLDYGHGISPLAGNRPYASWVESSLAAATASTGLLRFVWV